MGNQCLLSDSQSFMMALRLVCISEHKPLNNAQFQETIQADCEISENCQVSTDCNNKIRITNKDSTLKENEKEAQEWMIDFKFERQSIKIDSKNAWQIYGGQQLKRYVLEILKIQLEKDDIIKIDQSTIQLLEVFDCQKPIPEFCSSQSICKICYQPTSKNNTLIAPCNCSGSIRYVHVQCLRDDIKRTHGFRHQENRIRIRKQKLYCSICKYSYLKGLSKQGINIGRLFLDCKFTVFIMMLLKEPGKDDTIIFEKFDSNYEIMIGRSSSADLKLESGKVSRRHAKLIYDLMSGNVYIQDMKSMMGTQLLINKPIMMNWQDESIHIKMGNNILKLTKIMKIVDSNKMEIVHDTSSEETQTTLQTDSPVQKFN